jgi:uncharacterized protein (DUF1499 family)
MNLSSYFAIGFLLIVSLAAGALTIVGRDRVWQLFGPPDLGPVTFEKLVRRTTPNDALACLPGVCNAKIDINSPVFPVAARDLQVALAKVIELEPRTTLVAADEPNLTYRYIQRSKWMRFPDTIVVRLFDLPNGQSTILIYSRSQLGRGDLGVNRARIRRWLDTLVAQQKVG